MIHIVVSFISGIAAWEFFPFFPVLTGFVFMAVVLLMYLNRKRWLIFFFVPLFGFFYGFLRQDTLPDIKMPRGNVYLEGTIAGVPEISGGKLRLTVNKASMEGISIPGSVRLTALPYFKATGTYKKLYSPGDRISAHARLKAPASLRNPGVYAYDLKKEGIAATGYAKHINIIAREDLLLNRISGVRQKLAGLVDRSLSAENASLHNAMITGLSGGISRDMREAFSSTGLAHVLSISGTHFGLLALLFFTLTRKAVTYLPAALLTRITLYITPTQIAIGVTLPVLAEYAVLSGLSVPTLRSFIMVFIYMLSLLLGRKDQWLNSLSIAAFLILLWNPASLFDLSFVLSFTAVLSVGHVLEKEARGKGERSRIIPAINQGGKKGDASRVRDMYRLLADKTKTAISITLAAVLGTAPFVALYFKQFPLISPLTNLIVTPFICFLVLPLGFISGFIALIFDMPFMPLNGLIDTLTNSALRMINWFAMVPYANVHIHNPSCPIIAGYILSLVFLLKSTAKWKAAPLVIVMTIYLATPCLTGGRLTAVFLDAGQGDASVVELPDKKVMLIDGSTGGPDAGRMVIAPYLWAKGIKKIDYMVLSHSHPDHYGGLLYVLDHFDVGEIWFNGMISDDSKELFQRAAQKKVPYKVHVRGDVLEGDRYRIYVFHPYEAFIKGLSSEDYVARNSDSMVLKIESDDFSLLFTGDIEEAAEHDIAHLGALLKSDIIKVPHHGGRTSSTEALINAVRPEIAVMSAGRGNSFGHPHQETIQRYEWAGARVFRTDINGAITVTGGGRSYDIKTYDDCVLKRSGGLRDEWRNLRLLF